MDVAIDESEVRQIKDIIKSQGLVTGYHYLKTRQVGNIKYVEFHLVFNKTMLLIDAHRIGDDIEEIIPTIDTEYEWQILIHLDPYDDSI
jgi:ferrous-iron efflux pump FieF